jgi:hypothetical protein
MKAVSKIIYTTLFLLITIAMSAQYYNDGQEKASIKWKCIRTMNFEIIFPEGYEKQGNHVAKLMEKVYDYASFTLNHKPKKISVILHTSTVKSNAFLGWAPSRIEMYATPHQGIYSQDWLEQLAIHEFRHMVQISKLESEMPQIIRYILGEHAAAILTAAYLPFWFIEGDAVATETGLSNSGRGRLPDFQREIRTQLIEKGKYSYDKAYLGSYKDNVANHYNLGYLLVGAAREKYNKVIWDSVLSNVAKRPFSLNAFDKGLRKSIGINKIQLYNLIFDNLTQLWRKEDQSVPQIENVPISPKNKSFTNYNFCSKLSNGSYFSEKSSLSDINRFVSITNDGKEKILFTPGYHFDESVSAKDNFIIWSEQLSHPRWYHSDLSLVRIYDINTRKILEHKYNSKIFAPQLSSDYQKILAVETDNLYQFFLSVFDLKSGNRISQFHTPPNDYFITPSWIDSSNEVISIVMKNNEKGIARIDLKTGELNMIMDYNIQEIKKPREHNGFVYFIGGYTGIDNLYAISSSTGEIFKVIVSRFGISDFSFDQDSIIYNDYTADGFRLVKTSLDSTKFIAIDLNDIRKPFPIAENLALQEKGAVNFNELDDINYQSVNYSKPVHLINIHSWAPLAIDPFNYTVYPGISLMSQNMLSTAETVMGYRYKWEEKKGEFYAEYKYLGWFPVVDFQLDYGKSKSFFYQIISGLNNDHEVVKTDTIKRDFSWKKTNFSIKTYLPLNLSKGKYYRVLYPSLKYRYTFYRKDNNAPDYFPDGSFHSVETGFYSYIALHSSLQSIIPKFGIYLDAYFSFIFAGKLNAGNSFSLSNITYLPGFFPNHGIKIYNGFQKKEDSQFSISDRIRLPRGHESIDYKQMYSFSADYVFPLCFPDMKLGKWVYFKRINLSLFYDQAFLKVPIEDKYFNKTYQSTGCELTSNMHILQFIAPIELGIRSSYLFNKSFDFDFLFNVQFSF